MGLLLVRAVVVKSIFLFGDTPEASVAGSMAKVVSVLLGIERTVLSTNDLGKFPKYLRRSLFIISCIAGENHINIVRRLRLVQFGGPVILASRDAFDLLKRRHRILRMGHGSHDVCPAPLMLPDLLARVVRLAPLSLGNLKLIQKELKASETLLKRRIIPALHRLQKPNVNIHRELDKISSIVEDLCNLTPAACHTRVDIGGRKLQIHEHFRVVLKETRGCDNLSARDTELLREVFERWHEIVLHMEQ